jgi:xylulokinase
VTFLALDVGTSELKINVFDSSGQSLGAGRSEVAAIHSEGCRAEMDPEALWQAVRDGIQRLGVEVRSRVGAAAICCHGESFVALDRRGKPTRNIILNIDSRAAAEMAEFSCKFGPEALYRKTGLPSHPMYTVPKIAWMRRHEPDNVARSTRFLCLEDYILFRLGIDPAISKSLASRTLGFDIRRGVWDSELLQFAGIDEEQLSRVENSGTALGIASAKMAAELGLPLDVVWCTAGHDQACASIGTGALHAGAIADGTGTFECASVPLDEALVSETSLQANLPCEGHVLPDRFLTLAYVPGGIALKWLRDSFHRAPGYGYDEMLAKLPLEPTGIFCFPYFLGTGTPWLDSEAKAAIYGLSSTTSEQSLAQAMLEGISYEMRWNLEILRSLGTPIEQVFAAGGGATSQAWLQLKSDIFGRPVVQVPGEASSRGAAMCAAIAVGEFTDWNEAAFAMVKCGRVFEPRPAVEQRYLELFEEYRQLAYRLYDHTWPSGQI